ncbi:MAG TPA: outer membrane beta-barrel protein [Bryobacteraceae bacterium]|nr:outer membrane beta-barrel protein [Bryobacteraceae bacterium]
MKNFIRYKTILLAAVLLGSTQVLFSQEATQEKTPEPESFLRRFSIGGRMTVLGTNAMNSGDMARSASEPPVTVTTTTSSDSERVGGGVTLEFALTERISVGADLLYKRAGYNRSVVRAEGVDDTATTDKDERSITQDLESTRSDYWDLPIMARFYNKARGEGGARMFVLGGIAFRRATAVHTVRELVRANGLSDTYDVPVEPGHKTVGGVVVGAGIQLVDDIRFKFTPEIRLTRWFRSTFDNAPTQSPRNQMEIVLGLTF